MKKLALASLAILSLAGCKPAQIDGETAPQIGAHTQWMQHYQDRRLSELTLVASHDSGTHYQVPERATRLCIGGAFFELALTQRFDILGQLQSGARVFDVRPVDSRDGLYTAHATRVNIEPLGLDMDAGCRGQSMALLFDQVRTFLNTYPTEIVILNIRHIKSMQGMFADTPHDEVATQVKQMATEKLGDMLFIPQAFDDDERETEVQHMRVGDLVAKNRRVIMNMDCDYVDVAQGFLGCLSAQQDEPVKATYGAIDSLWVNSPFTDVVIQEATAAWLDHVSSDSTDGYSISWTATMEQGCTANAYTRKLFGKGLAELGAILKGAFQAGGIDVDAYSHCDSILAMVEPLNAEFIPRMQQYMSDGTFCYQQRPQQINLDFVDVELTSAVIAMNDPANFPVNESCPTP